MKDIRFVVVHRPGPQWNAELPVFEQPGLQAHVDHYRKLYDAGKLAIGGPFLDEPSGGMMVPAAGVGREEIEAFASDDPAGSAGRLTGDGRTWTAAMLK